MNAVVSPAPRGDWLDLLERDRDGLAFQGPAWLDAVCSGGGFEDASRLYETARGGRLLLPLARRRRFLPVALAPQASMPESWGMGGILADEDPATDDLRRVVSDLGSLRALRVTVRPNPLKASLWEDATSGQRIVRIPRRAHVLDLAGGSSRVWDDRFASSARRAVRKAERSDLEVRCGSSAGALNDYRTLFDLSVERWAAAQHEPIALARLRAARRDPRAKLGRAAAALGDGLRIWMAYRADKPVAGIVVALGRNASYTRGAMDKARCGPVAANEALHWHAIREACEIGCRSYQMGESGRSSGLARFKEKLGARPVDYAEYRFEHLPLTRADVIARSVVKRAVGFRDA